MPRGVVWAAGDDRQRFLAAVAVDPQLRLVEHLIERRPERFVVNLGRDFRAGSPGSCFLLAVVEQLVAGLAFDRLEDIGQRHAFRGKRYGSSGGGGFCRSVLDLLTNTAQPIAHGERQLVAIFGQRFEKPVGPRRGRTCEFQQLLLRCVALGSAVIVQATDQSADLLLKFIVGIGCGRRVLRVRDRAIGQAQEQR